MDTVHLETVLINELFKILQIANPALLCLLLMNT